MTLITFVSLFNARQTTFRPFVRRVYFPDRNPWAYAEADLPLSLPTLPQFSVLLSLTMATMLLTQRLPPLSNLTELNLLFCTFKRYSDLVQSLSGLPLLRHLTLLSMKWKDYLSGDRPVLPTIELDSLNLILPNQIPQEDILFSWRPRRLQLQSYVQSPAIFLTISRYLRYLGVHLESLHLDNPDVPSAMEFTHNSGLQHLTISNAVRISVPKQTVGVSPHILRHLARIVGFCRLKSLTLPVTPELDVEVVGYEMLSMEELVSQLLSSDMLADDLEVTVDVARGKVDAPDWSSTIRATEAIIRGGSIPLSSSRVSIVRCHGGRIGVRIRAAV
ncbi:hypothetical protein FB45DRAFT_1030280 [Roridomyces roridus]|uniref:Uncharacterized protein n=1 Tax=Roridomyces roridus TaxID=1738132 RepID=A0AAD7BNQ0_9AGAR|nr:hypothetical protein FB45DRAFT_1030280 [Roridomyces roridus]